MFSKYWKISEKVRYLKKQNKNKQTNLHDYIQKNSVKNIKENQILDFETIRLICQSYLCLDIDGIKVNNSFLSSIFFTFQIWFYFFNLPDEFC